MCHKNTPHGFPRFPKTDHKCLQNWLVVSTPLKNMNVNWDDYSQYMYGNIKNGPNHQPEKNHPSDICFWLPIFFTGLNHWFPAIGARSLACAKQINTVAGWYTFFAGRIHDVTCVYRCLHVPRPPKKDQFRQPETIHGYKMLQNVTKLTKPPITSHYNLPNLTNNHI